MSTSTRKGVKHVHRNLKQHQGPSCWQQPHQCKKNKWPHVNLEETETSNLPPRRNRGLLSYCSCPSFIPSCLYPTYLSGPHCQGRNAANCSLAKRMLSHDLSVDWVRQGWKVLMKGSCFEMIEGFQLPSLLGQSVSPLSPVSITLWFWLGPSPLYFSGLRDVLFQRWF